MPEENTIESLLAMGVSEEQAKKFIEKHTQTDEDKIRTMEFAITMPNGEQVVQKLEAKDGEPGKDGV